jgi:dTDP-glucose 4,6-dehydratase
MKVVITGGAGFIGTNFVRALAKGEYELPASSIHVIDKLTYAGRYENISDLVEKGAIYFHHGDISDFEFVSSIVSDADVVINFAAESHVDRSIESAREFIISNILGAQTLLDCIIQASKKVRFVQISTDEVYGSIIEGSWDESYPLQPNSPYAASKAAADMLVMSYVRTHNIDAVITRCSNNYGPYQFPEKAIPLFITSLLAGKQIPIYGDGSNIREWIHVSDHCRGIELVARRGASGEIYNIGSGFEISNLGLAKKLLEKMKLPADRISFVVDRKGHDKRYSLSIEKIKTSLGFQPSVAFEDGIASTLKWYKSRVNSPEKAI